MELTFFYPQFYDTRMTCSGWGMSLGFYFAGLELIIEGTICECLPIYNIVETFAK